MAEIGAKASICIVLLCFVGFSEALLESEGSIESRGKRKKLALLFYFGELVIKKFLIFKLIYAVIFFIFIHKAGFFIKWLLSYLKEQKHHHGYHEVEYYYHQPHHNKEYGPPGYAYGTPDTSYGAPDLSYSPYRGYNPQR